MLSSFFPLPLPYAVIAIPASTFQIYFRKIKIPPTLSWEDFFSQALKSCLGGGSFHFGAKEVVCWEDQEVHCWGR